MNLRSLFNVCSGTGQLGRLLAAPIWLITCSVGTAAVVSPDEMIVAQRWVAARLLGGQEVPPPAPGLTVLANYGPVQKDGRGEQPLRLGDILYTRGLYCHADSRVIVRLPGPAKALTAVLGVDTNDQTRGGPGSVVFAVEVGGKEVFRSEPVREGMPPLPLQVDLRGAREVVLSVQDAGDGIACDQADWADARIVLSDDQVLALTDLPLLNVSTPPPSLDPPFSFLYDGRPAAELLPDWRVARQSRALDDCRMEHTLTYTDPVTKLTVRCVAIEYRDYPAVEWTVYFRNAGEADTPILSEIRALDIEVDRGPGVEFMLHHQRGDACTPESYQPLSVELKPDAVQCFASSGGRPTQGGWPYWNVQWGRAGLLAALGWPGQWSAEFVRDGGQVLRIRAGQELTHFTLHPAEEVRTPLVALQFYDGDRVRSQNIWRRWMLAHNLPRQGNQPLRPLFTSCSGGFFPGLRCNEADEFRFIDTFTKSGIKLDYWWMDAGWYVCDAWPQVGTWEIDTARFPRGLKAISDHVHALQTGLILWFEPERVMPGSWLYTTHPDWLLGPDGQAKLLNLGHLEARAWLVNHIDAFITREGIDLYRQDFNMDPLPYWRAADAADRQGITEIRHVTGYLAYWDELRRRHPGMLIDSCASGGRRNDLETLRRAVPLLRSDYQSFVGDPAYALGNQCHTYGLSSWVPYYGQGVYYNNDQLLYAVRSHYSPAFGFCTDVRQAYTDWDLFRKAVDDWRRISANLLGDYYPLTPYSLADDVWMAWQFDRPESGEGVVQAFRRASCIYVAASLRLQGLEPDASYELTNLDVPGTAVKTGRELADGGLRVTIDQRPGAALVLYRKVAR